jgi:hypothetical protein
MAYTTDSTTNQALQTFQGFDADTQLALLWYGYLDLKDQLRPTTDPSVQDVGAALFDQIQQLSKEEQLQAQRDIVSCAGSSISQAYSALSSSGKLDLWLRLAQGMEQGSIIQVPSDYELPSQTDNFVEMIKGLNFEQRINFTRSAVVAMGTSPIS